MGHHAGFAELLEVATSERLLGNATGGNVALC